MALERFSGRKVLVTGGASGIGRCTALRLADEGAAVVAVDVNAEALARVAAEADGLSGSIVARPGDVSTEIGVKELVSGAVATLGSLDVVVNVAGVLSFSHSHEVTLDEWNRLIAVNLTGTFLVCRESLPHLLASKGNIVNLASTASHAGQPWAVAYSASKGGVLAMTRELAIEYAEQGLRCNSVSPGAIDTPITLAFELPEGANAKLLRRVSPLGPFGTPEGIAAAIAFVASDEASHMNGADIRIDGGTLS
ncbi:MAG: SDR family NAD(P)-dependent oxidoreductase [Acidimicrobiales bacterium]|jgi:NAD(P)-dependent dehydrogenase (short-subunit alcohol dehydrogenase family)